MKIMTCAQMGGPCDHTITASTPEEMMKKGMEHLEIDHPEIAKKMKDMSYDENKEWNHSFMKTWRMTHNSK